MEDEKKYVEEGKHKNQGKMAKTRAGAPVPFFMSIGMT
jgi:hypothetical protein